MDVDIKKIKWSSNKYICPECNAEMIVPKYLDKDDEVNTKVNTVSHGCGSWTPVDIDAYIPYLKLYIKLNKGE